MFRNSEPDGFSDPQVTERRGADRATDCLNEKGLYIQTDMREADEKFVNYGLHSAHGEKTREDGTPWSELRLCIVAIPVVVSQNCATVDEAVAFLKNSYDWYSIKMPGHHFDQVNFCNLNLTDLRRKGIMEAAIINTDKGSGGIFRRRSYDGLRAAPEG